MEERHDERERGMTDIISYWLENCIYGSLQAYKALAQAGYQHDWIRHGDLGGIKARIDGRFFEPDRYGEFWVAQPIWVEQPTGFHYVEDLILEDIIVWKPLQPDIWHFLRGETGLILGEENLVYAQLAGEKAVLHRTPLDWLKAGRKGAVLLDEHGLHRGVVDVGLRAFLGHVAHRIIAVGRAADGGELAAPRRISVGGGGGIHRLGGPVADRIIGPRRRRHPEDFLGDAVHRIVIVGVRTLGQDIAVGIVGVGFGEDPAHRTRGHPVILIESGGKRLAVAVGQKVLDRPLKQEADDKQKPNEHSLSQIAALEIIFKLRIINQICMTLLFIYICPQIFKEQC